MCPIVHLILRQIAYNTRIHYALCLCSLNKLFKQDIIHNHICVGTAVAGILRFTAMVNAELAHLERTSSGEARNLHGILMWRWRAGSLVCPVHTSLGTSNRAFFGLGGKWQPFHVQYGVTEEKSFAWSVVGPWRRSFNGSSSKGLYHGEFSPTLAVECRLLTSHS